VASHERSTEPAGDEIVLARNNNTRAAAEMTTPIFGSTLSNQPMTIDVQGADIKTVLRSISEFSGVTSSRGRKSRDRVIHPRTFLKALDTILKSQGDYATTTASSASPRPNSPGRRGRRHRRSQEKRWVAHDQVVKLNSSIRMRSRPWQDDHRPRNVDPSRAQLGVISDADTERRIVEVMTWTRLAQSRSSPRWWTSTMSGARRRQLSGPSELARR
jgi:hypothetical protein